MWHSLEKFQSVRFVSSKEFKGKMSMGKDAQMKKRRCHEEREKTTEASKGTYRNITGVSSSAFGRPWNSYPQPGLKVHICWLRSSALKSSLNLSTIYFSLMTKMEFGPDCCVIDLIHWNMHKHKHQRDLKCPVNISKDFEIAGKGWGFILHPLLI